jgi:hypothetical protein
LTMCVGVCVGARVFDYVCACLWVFVFVCVFVCVSVYPDASTRAGEFVTRTLTHAHIEHWPSPQQVSPGWREARPSADTAHLGSRCTAAERCEPLPAGAKLGCPRSGRAVGGQSVDCPRLKCEHHIFIIIIIIISLNEECICKILPQAPYDPRPSECAHRNRLRFSRKQCLLH